MPIRSSFSKIASLMNWLRLPYPARHAASSRHLMNASSAAKFSNFCPLARCPGMAPIYTHRPMRAIRLTQVSLLSKVPWYENGKAQES